MQTPGADGEGAGPARAAVNLNSPRVLVLNASYEPLHVTSAKRAITLIQYGVAEVLEESLDVVRSPSTVLPIPSVIRLRRYVRRPRLHPIPFSRRNVLRRDAFRCQYCGSHDDLTIDHVFPRSRGGRHGWENVVTACRGCNQRKGSRTPDEAGMPLPFAPRAPSFGFYAYGQFAQMREGWGKYIGDSR
ncbi:MAG: HNH endonuclease [Deinococcus sp.]